MLLHALAEAKGGKKGWQPRADWIAYVALAAVPWGGEFYSKSEYVNQFENVLDLADEYAKKRTANPDSATTIIKSADGNEIDWFMEMHARLSAARTNQQWNILSIPAIAEPFVDALAKTSNAHALPMIEITTIAYANHAEASAHYPGRSILR
jgi:nuclear cap-binding protein subunit 1